MQWLRLVCLIPLMSPVLSAQSFPASWVGQKPVDPFSNEKYCGNYSRIAWIVSNRAGELVATPVDVGSRVAVPAETLKRAESIPGFKLLPSARITSLPYANRVLIGIDQGEFGGGLCWMSDRNGSAERLSAENVQSFLQIQGKWLVLSGLAHDGLSEGKAFEVKVESGKVALLTLANLGASPGAAHVGSDSFIVATNQGVARVSLTGNVRWLARTDYGALFPRSTVELPNGRIYVGMSRFVVELAPDTNGYTER